MKIAIIGCGKQAPKHISGLRTFDDVEHIYVADLYPQASNKLASQYESGVTALPIESLLDQDRLDAVIITTPTASHADLCEQAILKGLPFLVEKPLCATYEDAKKILTLSQAHNVNGMVGFIYRFCPIFDHMKSVIAKGEASAIGTSQQAFFRIAGRGSHQSWKHQRATLGGAVNEMMVHMIDLAVWYFGNVKSFTLLDHKLHHVERMIQGENVTCDAEDDCSVRLHMEDGTQVLIQSDMISPAFKQYAEINGQNGIIEGSIQGQYQNALTLFEARDGCDKGYQALNLDQSNFYVSQSECLINMVRSGQAPTKCTLTEAVEVMRVQKGLQDAMWG